MEKFMKFLNEKLTPLANFFGRQRHGCGQGGTAACKEVSWQ